MEKNDSVFKVKKNKINIEKGVRVQPNSRYSIYKGTLRIIDIPDHFPPDIQKGIGNSIIIAWRKSGILPIIKL